VGIGHLVVRFFVLGVFAFATTAAVSQTISVTSPDPQLNNVVSAPTGDTIFTISPSTGAVTVTGGTGYRVSPGTTRAVVTLTCPNVGACNTKDVDVTISAVGSPTKRARALTNFTVANGTATVKVPPGVTGTNPITFQLNPIGRSATKYFYLAMDFPIAGDNSGLPTGVATSDFLINATAASVNISANGQARATVFRPITIGLTSNLSFGTISRPFAGNGTVSLDSATGDRTLTGQGVQAILASPVRATYTVSGEGGQVFSISVPPTFTMAGATDNLTVTTNNDAAGLQILSGSLGSAGSRAFHVGGSFPVTSTTGLGNYTGSFAVTVQYN
jgi:hypothetical protein